MHPTQLLPLINVAAGYAISTVTTMMLIPAIRDFVTVSVVNSVSAMKQGAQLLLTHTPLALPAPRLALPAPVSTDTDIVSSDTLSTKQARISLITTERLKGTLDKDIAEMLNLTKAGLSKFCSRNNL